MYNFLNTNYQRVSTNRFIVDSDKFWKKEFHPRFNDLFEETDFSNVIEKVNTFLSFNLEIELTISISKNLYGYFSDFRFSLIPAKNPNCKDMFLSDLFFTLMDILRPISFTQKELTDDDFNVVTNKAETGKNDTTNISTNDKNNKTTKLNTQSDYLVSGELRNQSTVTSDNIDEETEQNSKGTTDVFLSAQNQGKSPTTINTKHEGVDGISIDTNGSFTTNVNVQNSGESTKNKANSNSLSSQSDDSIREDKNIYTGQENTDNIEASNNINNIMEKNDNYIETLDYNKGERLLNFYELNKDRLFLEILNRLSNWILQVNIATSDNNYIDYEVFE